MNLHIIYPIDGDKVAQLAPAQEYLATLPGTLEEKLIFIANRDLPTGTPYEIIDTADLPEDRSQRDLWTYESGTHQRISEEVSHANQD